MPTVRSFQVTARSNIWLFLIQFYLSERCVPAALERKVETEIDYNRLKKTRAKVTVHICRCVTVLGYYDNRLVFC